MENIIENISTNATTPTTNNKMLELLKKRAEKDNAKVLSTAEAQKERELAESKKRKLFKLNSAVNSLGIEITAEEMKKLEAFFTSGDALETNFELIRFLPSAHRHLKKDPNSKDIEIREDGIYAIIRTDMNGRRICNVCYPDLDARLRPIDFKYRLELALEDWIIELKELKVQGTRVNTDFSERGLEIASEKEYLQKVSNKMMASEVITKITDAICKSAVYNNIQVNAVMYTFDANNNRINKSYLFSMDPVEYTQKMGAIAVGNRRFDMLQGDVEVVDLTIKNGEILEDCRIACIDPEQPSLYLHKGKSGYHVNLYIPEEIMQAFFNV